MGKRQSGRKTIPLGPCLVLMIGPSGAGKSTFIAKRFKGDAVVSSDTIRHELLGDFRDNTANEHVFRIYYSRISEGLRSGKRVIADATHLHGHHRFKSIKTARKIGCPVVYVIIDRPLEKKRKTAGWRKDIIVKGKSLIDSHDETFRQQEAHILSGDNGNADMVIDTRHESFRVARNKPGPNADLGCKLF